MKRFHFPTLILHILLIVFAALAINDYPDLFLGVSVLLLLAHIAWVICLLDFYLKRTAAVAASPSRLPVM